MTPQPITLVGDNLGARHRYFNELVAQEQRKNENFHTIRLLPEKSALDKLFKIDLAVKSENLEYILENLKHDDMLYVSCSLKAKWLLDKKYEATICPKSLEDNMYPDMITTAINKMKHWIHLNLKDEKRSQQFFQFYYKNDPKYALKFFPKCSAEFIVNEFPTIIKDVTPKLLKLLSEKTPIVAKMFFEAIVTDKLINTIYDKNATEFFNSVKCVLKLDSEIYLNILERHFRTGAFKRLSPAATDYIMVHRKDMFWKKPELYTSWFLDVKTVANILSADECENLVLQLARCKFLDFWFEYKTVEPFIKRMDVTKRAEFKKRVFVEKDIGEEIKEWPYPLPKTYPIEEDRSSVIDDNEDHPPIQPCLYRARRKMCLASQRFLSAEGRFPNIFKPKTELDKLFDVYRFKNFKECLYELRKNIKSMSSSQARMHMFLVLISKSGGKTEHFRELFELLLKYSNEQLQVRAAVVRSLVKRASIWRADDELWQQMLTYGHGLGLDGSQSEVECYEGLHAVIIRNILTGVECSPAVKKAYLHMNAFTTFKDYKLTGAEKKTLIDGLQKMLLALVFEDTDQSLAAIQYLLDILDAYKIRIDITIIEAVKHYVSRDMNIGLLRRLYDAKIGRKELHSYNFEQFASGAAYDNALKHDPTILSTSKLLEILKYQRLDSFFNKLSLYFGESGGMVGTFLRALLNEKPERKYARPIVRLIGEGLKSYILQIDSYKDDDQVKRYAADVRANAHLGKPKIDLKTLINDRDNSIQWKQYGCKFLANIVLVGKTVDYPMFSSVLTQWKRSVKLATIMARRMKDEHAVMFRVLAAERPTVAFKYGLNYFKQNGSNTDTRIWESFKPLVTKLESSFEKHTHLLQKARQINRIPLDFRPEYITLLYPILKQMKDKTRYCLPSLRHMKKLLQKMDERFMDNILTDFFTNVFKVAKCWSFGVELVDYNYSTLHIDLLGKYMLLCKDAETLDRRYENIVLVFLRKLEPHLRESTENSIEARGNFETFMRYLMYDNPDENCVSLTPVLEKIVKWMQGVLPMEQNFKFYVQTHVSMLHHKAKRQCLKQFPEMFAEKKLSKESAAVLGEILGRYIAHDANELKSKYFDSIIDLYGGGLGCYLYEYNRLRIYGKNGEQINEGSNLALGVIKGLLEEGKGSERRMVMSLYLRNIIYLDEDVQKAEKMIKQCNDDQIRFLYNSKFLEWDSVAVFNM